VFETDLRAACTVACELVEHGVALDVTETGLHLRSRDPQSELSESRAADVQQCLLGLYFLTQATIDVERGQMQLKNGRDHWLDDTVIRLMWVRKQAGLSRTPKRRTTCDECGRLFRPRLRRSIHLRFSMERLNTITGERLPANDLTIDYCSRPCRDVAIDRGLAPDGGQIRRFGSFDDEEQGKREAERVIQELMSGRN
jgi:hypothetical protein